MDRVERVLAFHQTTKIVYGQPLPAPPSDPGMIPPAFRVFKHLPEIKLPTTLLDAAVPVVTLLQEGRDALPESLISPPQDLKTLATWLFLADGIIPVRRQNKVINNIRTCPSAEGSCPYEIYVAAFSIQGLEPGLYHFNPQSFSLRKFRDGPVTLSLLKRGRPDLEFIKSTPGAILVSSVFSRSSSRFVSRGYRSAIMDCGQMTENIIVSGSALGIQTMTRLRLTESNMRDLIGLSAQPAYADAESVVSMIMWTDLATTPPGFAGAAPGETLNVIAREPTSPKIQCYSGVVQTHEDVMVTGVGIRDIRPPFTELMPIPGNMRLFEKPFDADQPSRTLFRTVVNRRSAPGFVVRPINRDPFLLVNHTAFRGGSYYPLYPDGPHVALVRPYWLISDVMGMDPGIWYYHPPSDKWTMLASGVMRRQSAQLALGNPVLASAAAVCVIVADLEYLMRSQGPDLYRLAHLEAGFTSQRMYLTANSLDLGCRIHHGFYDDEVRKFFALDQTTWQPLCFVALGMSVDDTNLPMPQHQRLDIAGPNDWRD